MTKFLDVTLTSKRLMLKPMHKQDAAQLYEVFSDPVVMKYWNTPPWEALVQAEKDIAESNQWNDDGSALTLGVYLKEGGSLIGKVLLFNFHTDSRRAEIGFGIGQGHWGKGYVTEASRCLLDYAFNHLGLRRLEAEIDPDNLGSSKTLHKLGFVQEGLLKERWMIDGVISDSLLFGLLQSDWLSKVKCQ